MPAMPIDGRTLSYAEAGAGFPTLLLHPFPLDSRVYATILAAPPEGLRLLAPDFPGFGGSEPIDGPLPPPAIADAVVALLDARGIERAIVAGVSMGGYVALSLLQRFPDRVAALVLCATNARDDDEAMLARRAALAAEVERRGSGAAAEVLAARLLRPEASAEVLAAVDGSIRSQSPAGVAGASRGMALRPDTRFALRMFVGPCLAVAGELDQLTPRALVEELAVLPPNGTLQVVAGAGHLVPVEAPGEFAAALATVRARLTGAAAR